MPSRSRIKAPGSETPVRRNEGRHPDAAPHDASYRGELSGTGWRITTRSRMEYDGYALDRLRIVPPAAQSEIAKLMPRCCCTDPMPNRRSCLRRRARPAPRKTGDMSLGRSAYCGSHWATLGRTSGTPKAFRVRQKTFGPSHRSLRAAASGSNRDWARQMLRCDRMGCVCRQELTELTEAIQPA